MSIVCALFKELELGIYLFYFKIILDPDFSIILFILTRQNICLWYKVIWNKVLSFSTKTLDKWSSIWVFVTVLKLEERVTW